MNEVEEFSAIKAEPETARRDTRLEDQMRDLIEKTIAQFSRRNGVVAKAGTGTTPCAGRQ